MESEIERFDHKFNIEVLCIGYSKETLKLQLKKKIDGIAENGPDMIDNKFWNSISQFELQEAISHYDEEQYRRIRDEIVKDKGKDGTWKGLRNDGRRKHKANEITERPYSEGIRVISWNI